MKGKLAITICLAALGSPAFGQDLPKGQFPDGFKVRTDRANQSAADNVFVTMSPGWHITTGPAAIFYDPANTASGEYRVESETFLFDPGPRNEAYGFFIGGRELEGEAQAYTYFLVRKTGEFLIRRRHGAETSDVVAWTAHPAILKYADKGEAGTAKNVLALDVGPENVRFSVNGQQVASLPRAGLDTDGIVGLRVNHGLNVHVGSLTVTKR